MGHTVEGLWQMSQTQLLSAYHEARLLYAEKKLARDTERGRLQWLRARTFVNSRGTVTERMNYVDASDDLARKGQHVREMSHSLDLLKSDIDLVAVTLRLRGVAPPSAGAIAGPVAASESEQDEDRE